LGTLIAQGDVGQNELTGTETEYLLGSVSDPNISGTATFAERESGSTLITLQLTGTTSGGDHPSHIHMNTAAEGGGIVLSLTNVDGGTGLSITSAEMLDDGTSITYDELINFDGYINVHFLGTLIAQGDVGQNELTGTETEYLLGSVSDPNISGTATFAERESGSTLITIELIGTRSGGDHPSHIHMNTAAEGGGIVLSLTNVDGATGISKTSAEMLDDGTAITYSELINFDGYINVHSSSSDLGTLIAQGDIGQNALTGMAVEYTLSSVSDMTISGTATFSERENGFTLITIELIGTTSGGLHPSHIHMNTAAEGGSIVLSLTDVDGGTGISKTSAEMLDDGTAITYSELINFDGYINVHSSSSDLATLIAQGDIGQNALTGMAVEYTLSSKSDITISGTATFSERENGFTLITIELIGTTSGGLHPSHIHMNTAAQGGSIVLSLTDVDGGTGISKTSAEMLDDTTAITYSELINFDGYINVHSSSSDLATLIAQGDIGSNAN